MQNEYWWPVEHFHPLTSSLIIDNNHFCVGQEMFATTKARKDLCLGCAIQNKKKSSSSYFVKKYVIQFQ